MDDTWTSFRDKVCNKIEENLLGISFNNKDLLIRALTRSAKLNEKVEFEELKSNGDQIGLDTIGDTILDFVIFDHFTSKGFSANQGYTPEELNKLREQYGNNSSLHKFSKNKLELPEFILWGPDEKRRKIWNDMDTDLLADCFEALIGALYIDQGIEEVRSFFERIHYFGEMEKLLIS